MKLFEVKHLKKAGFLPYYMDRNIPVFLFMTSSDSRYGGHRPMIAKGHIDGSESPREAALREAEEELGLKYGNLTKNTVFQVSESRVIGLTDTYTLTVFAGEVNDVKDFKKPHYETRSTHWLSLREFKLRGRSSHISIVGAAHDAIVAKNEHV